MRGRRNFRYGRNRFLLRQRRACQYESRHPLAFFVARGIEATPRRPMCQVVISDEHRSDDASGALAGYANAGSFNNRGTNGNFWSSSESGATAWNRNLNSANATVNRNANDKTNAFSASYDAPSPLAGLLAVCDLWSPYRKLSRRLPGGCRVNLGF